jgi:hypothetical protein
MLTRGPYFRELVEAGGDLRTLRDVIRDHASMAGVTRSGLWMRAKL